MRIETKRVHRFSMPSYLILNTYIQEVKKEKPSIEPIEKGKYINFKK